MKKVQILMLLLLVAGSMAYAREYHVSTKGNDTGTGTEAAPFRTINRAAQAAYPGDVITVHAGTYREWVNPPRGGTSDDNRIVYRAAPGEHVEIKGSEVVNTWTAEGGGVWKVTLPNSFFGDYNPYTDPVYGDWFIPFERIHHTGEVFLNNKSLYEKETLEKVRKPEVHSGSKDPDGSLYTWYCESDAQNTTIWANFHRYNPNRELVEISVRRTCFYPEKQGINCITVQGFHISEAASQWAAPTAEQIGMVATHWNRGWIIENNVISNAKCAGITLGKERSTGHNVWLEDMSLDGSLHFIEVTFRTLRNGWSRENTGSHTVRNNEIFSCEQAGICGSMGAAFSTVENNYIHDIFEKRQFAGAEIAGVKFHAAIDVLIRGNRIRNTGRGVWLDWMAQGSRISNNLIYESDHDDIFLEVNHGPHLVDNNILGSGVSMQNASQGGTFVHNIFAGKARIFQDRRYTPYHLPHRTDIAGMSIIMSGDDRIYNNLFMPVDPDANGSENLTYSSDAYPYYIDGNAYWHRAVQPGGGEEHFISNPDFDPGFKIEDAGKEVYVSFSVQGLSGLQTQTVTTERLGRAKMTKEAWEQPDGTPIIIDRDYCGVKRKANPTPGPFEQLKEGENRIRVW